LLHAEREPQSPREWELWLTATRKAIRKRAVIAWGAGTPDERTATRLIHSHCHRRSPAMAAKQRFCLPARLQGLLEPWCGESPHARF
jgi:hypothetical protein